MVDVFESYLTNGQPPDVDPSGGQQPASYYNPYLHATVNNIGCNPHMYHHVTGTITDDNNVPIKDAYVYAWVDLGCRIEQNPCPDALHDFDLIHTYSDENGEFVLDVMNYKPDNYFNFWYFVDVHVTAAGGERVMAGWGNVPAVFYSDLEKTDLEMDAVFDNITISNGQTRNFYAWNTLSLSGIDIRSGGTSEMKALTEVSLSPPSIFRSGSEVHIWCGTVYSDCDDFQNFKSQSLPEGLENKEPSNPAEIGIQFKICKNYLSVAPNPGSGIFRISLMSNDREIMQKITLLDLSGRKLIEKKVDASEIREDLSPFPPGMYFLEVTDENDLKYSQRIVIQ